jgi:PAS domain S-box-containing protein
MVGEQVETCGERLPPRPSSVGRARRLVRRALARSGREDLLDTAELLVSELVTNALVHAGTPIDVSLTVHDRGLRAEISDGSPHVPARRSYGPTAGTGRGLLLLEQMVHDWGVDRRERGKTVWFHLSADDHLAAEGVPADPVETQVHGRRGHAPDTVLVELRRVPLLLLAAWRQHAEALLREHLLASLETDGGEDPIEVHAAASDAISLLAEHVPDPDLGEDPRVLLVAALEPRVSAPRVVIPVPRRSVRSFAVLARTLRRALELAEQGALLTTPTQPEVQELREWVCAEVARQAEGHPPTPWNLEAVPPAPPGPAPEFDITPVSMATTARLAADDANRIIAASRSMAEILGYDDPAELVGQRLVAIVPERFRQAHLAGYTLHFLTGRGPLLDRAVVVPARRRDGSEVAVSLTLHRRRGPDGRVVFLADVAAVPVPVPGPVWGPGSGTEGASASAS